MAMGHNRGLLRSMATEARLCQYASTILQSWAIAMLPYLYAMPVTRSMLPSYISRSVLSIGPAYSVSVPVPVLVPLMSAQQEMQVPSRSQSCGTWNLQ